MDKLREETAIFHVSREENLFAGLRAPASKRAELLPRMQVVREACEDAICGPLTTIFYFDTPVDGFDVEVGFPVSKHVETGSIHTHLLKPMHFFSTIHTGPLDTLGETSRRLYKHMSTVGLSPELELMEVYHRFDPEHQEDNRIEVRAAFLAWPEVFREQLLRVLGDQATKRIWKGGERMTPFTPVDERTIWVGGALERLKAHTDHEQQFDILSRVALIRPEEDWKAYRATYEAGGIEAVLEEKSQRLAKTRTGAPVDGWRYEDGVLHLSKVPYNAAEYGKAGSMDEKRKSFCHCVLIREAEHPKVDPIFCYRAAGWARQFYEPLMGKSVESCTLTHSILKGDPYCAWDFRFED